MSGSPSPRYNLAVRRGISDVVFSYEDRYNVVLSEPVPAGTVTTPINQIRVQSVPADIPSGTELAFVAEPNSCTVYRVVTSGIAVAGSKTIQIQPLTSNKLIPCHWFADCGAVDLTGRVYRAQVKKKLTDATPFLTLTCTTTPLAGFVRVSCTTTGAEEANATFLDLPTSNDELQLINSLSKTGQLVYPQYKKIIDAAWVWDLEYTIGGRIVPEYTGLFWLQAEATVVP